MFNFLESFHDTHDKSMIKNMTNEMIDLYGQPCLLLKRDNENNIDDDPLYNDSLSITKRFYDRIPARVYIDYKNFAEILYAWGHTRLQNEHLYGVMKYDFHPDEGDVIVFTRPYDGKMYTFELTSTDDWKEICYNVVLTVIYLDVKDLLKAEELEA